MTTITAKIILDSISAEGKRLTTLQLRYPLIIHAESKTHRLLYEDGGTELELATPGLMNDPALSRNARSSRAVPVEKLIQEVMDDPYVPLHWGANQKGMQAYEECFEYVLVPDDNEQHKGKEWDRAYTNVEAWLAARDQAVMFARAFHTAGYAKQIVNRLLNPWMHIDTLVSATEWDGFFEQRIHHAAEPHMRMLAEAIKAAMDASTPELLLPGMWHLPYITLADENAGQYEEVNLDMLRMISVARCARISYAPFDGEGSYEAELKRYDLLVGSKPGHWSPTEHQATPDTCFHFPRARLYWNKQGEHGNLVGWRQNRHVIANEMRIAA